MTEQVIWKWDVTAQKVNEIEVPRGAQFLTVQLQNGLPRVWALVDPSAPREKRKLWVMPTGAPWECRPLRYIGTFQVERQTLVFHLFEELADHLPTGDN